MKIVEIHIYKLRNSILNTWKPTEFVYVLERSENRKYNMNRIKQNLEKLWSNYESKLEDREKWIKGLAHERRLSDKVGSHCAWTIMDSKLEVWNMSILNCKWKSHKYRWQDVQFWFGICMKNVSKGKEKITKWIHIQWGIRFRLTLLEAVDEAELMVVVALREWFA